MELSKCKDLDIFVTGGHLRGEWFSLVGPTATQSLSHLLIHTLFIGDDGPKWKISCYIPDEAQLNSTMAKHARRKIVVVDHSKFGKVAGWRICPTSDRDIVITDSGATDEMVVTFEKAQIQVMRV